MRKRRECRERFPRHRLQRKSLVSDLGMHHDTCVTHVPWCMSRPLTRGGGENGPGIPGTGATHNFTYLARGPCGRTLSKTTSGWVILINYVLIKMKYEYISIWGYSIFLVIHCIFFPFSGYGNIAPKTIGGRLFTILFGLFGIPLNLALIAACGTKVKVKSLDLTEKLYARYQCAKFRDRDRKILSLFSIIILGLLIFMAIPAVIFMYVEGWTFVDSLYYTFVTLTTIGIGDFVAGYGE